MNYFSSNLKFKFYGGCTIEDLRHNSSFVSLKEPAFQPLLIAEGSSAPLFYSLFFTHMKKVIVNSFQSKDIQNALKTLKCNLQEKGTDFDREILVCKCTPRILVVYERSINFKIRPNRTFSHSKLRPKHTIDTCNRRSRSNFVTNPMK